MAISVQNVVGLLLSGLLIVITIFLFTSDNARFPFPSLSPTDYYTTNPKSPSPQLDVSSDHTSQKMNVSSDHTLQKMKLNPSEEVKEIKWDLCKGAGSVDYIPCLDNFNAIKQLKSRRHMEHRERHCPQPSPKCLIPLPDNYKSPVTWPKSRDMIWYDNVPHPKLVEYKKEQNWVKKTGKFLVFPGGGTQFKFGVTHYVEFIEKALPAIKWGKNIRVVLDVGCGVASFGGFLLDKDVITMSFAPKDEHEAQIQFALERGIPATLSVIGTQQLPFPSNAFDLIHCARCRVHWDADGGKPLLELNRVLRPGGFFIWSATPVYRDNDRDTRIWNAMVSLTKSICWKVVTKTVDSSGIGLVIYQKPASESCYNKRSTQDPPLCEKKEVNASWYVPLAKCISKLPSGNVQRWPELWPKRLVGIKPQSISVEAETLKQDTEKWSAVVSDVYLERLAVNWSSVRNVMDMNAGYGSFAAALVNQPLWVMNVVPVNKPDTLSIVYDRGLIGVYHDWCESLSTYPRTYDLLHSSFFLGDVTQRCEIVQVAAEIDRIVRPGGYLVVEDTMETIKKLESVFGSLHWSIKTYQERFLVGRKGLWRPIKGKI